MPLTQVLRGLSLSYEGRDGSFRGAKDPARIKVTADLTFQHP